jgi:hypothetical protein
MRQRGMDLETKPGKEEVMSARRERERLWAIGDRKVEKVRRRRWWKRWEGQ